MLYDPFAFTNRAAEIELVPGYGENYGPFPVLCANITIPNNIQSFFNIFRDCFNHSGNHCSDLALAAVDLRKTAQVEALSATAGALGFGIRELQAAV